MTKTKMAGVFDKYTVELEDLQALGASTSGAVTLDTLPANSIVTMVVVKPTTAVAGAGPVTAATGRVASNSKNFATAYSLMTVSATAIDFDDEAQFVKATSSDLLFNVALTGGNAEDLTAGEVDIYVEYITLD